MAALELIDAEGLGTLSMRKLGDALAVEAMSLYRYVASKDALLDGVVELLTDEIEIPAPGAEPWQDAIRRIMRSYRRLAHRHPHAFPLIALRPLATPRSRARADAVLELLGAAGFDRKTAILAFRTAASYANGFLLEEVARAHPYVTTGDRDAEYAGGTELIIAGLESVRPPRGGAGE